MKMHADFLMAYKELLIETWLRPEHEVDSRLGIMKESIGRTIKFSNMASVYSYNWPKLDKQYANLYLDWLMSGDTISESLIKEYPHLKKWFDGGELDISHSTAYGPRMLEQMHAVVNELTNKSSRRAVMHILYPKDKKIWLSNTGYEYPCTIALQFFYRAPYLHVHSTMRSQNIVSVIHYDIWNFVALASEIAGELQQVLQMPVMLGNYYHTMGSAHILEKDFEFMQNIINGKK